MSATRTNQRIYWLLPEEALEYRVEPLPLEPAPQLDWFALRHPETHALAALALSQPGQTGAPAFAVWLTGLSSAGKTTLGRATAQALRQRGLQVAVLDGDRLRPILSPDLGYNKASRDENVRRIGALAQWLTQIGVVPVVSAISPYRAARDAVRRRIPRFVEVYVNAPLEVCESRDEKGLYRRARAGEITGLSGVDDPYEPPLHPEVECRTDQQSVDWCVEQILLHCDHAGRPESLPADRVG